MTNLVTRSYFFKIMLEKLFVFRLNTRMFLWGRLSGNWSYLHCPSILKTNKAQLLPAAAALNPTVKLEKLIV